MVCAHCGAAITDGQETCAGCGAPVARQNAIGADDEINRLLAEANLLRIRKQHDDAIGLCTRVLRIDPSNATAHALMGDIYRDEGNHREALGWYKLAVQLDPTNQADQKKLDEMIDRVFQDAQQGEAQEDVVASEPAVPVDKKNFISAQLEKITPTHVIIGSVVLAILAVVLISAGVFDQGGRPSHTGHAPRTATTSPADGTTQPTPSTTAPTGQLPQVVPPGPDTVEGGTKLPGLPIIVQNDPPSSTAPAQRPTMVPRQTAPSYGASTYNKNPVAQVPPFQPQQRNRMTAEDLERETAQLRAALANSLKDAKLPFSLTDLWLDPRTRTAIISYDIPHMQGPVETKQGLLYAGFYLIWQAQKADISLRKFTLRGFAFSSSGKETGKEVPSLALQADISPQQADDASEMGDYQSVAKCMSDAWWRGDLVTVIP